MLNVDLRTIVLRICHRIFKQIFSFACSLRLAVVCQFIPETEKF